MKLNLRNKLLGAFLIMIGLTVVVSAIALLSQANAQATVDELLNVHGRISDLSQQSTIAMLEARRSEKDYLLRYKDGTFDEARGLYVVPVQAAVAAIQADAAAIRELTEAPDVLEALAAIEQASAEYETTFLATVALIEQRGHVDTGLEGQFRARVHDLEAVVTTQNLDALTIDLLTIRRHEKDYLLRGDAKYIDALHQAVADFQSDARASGLPPAEVEALTREADAYQALFDELVQVNAQIAASIQAYREAIHKLEPRLEEINQAALASVAGAEAAEKAAAQTTTLTVIAVSLAAAVIGLAIAFVLSGSLSGAARRMVAAAEQIAHVDLSALATAASALADGDMTARLAIQAQALPDASSDEMGDLARAFNLMIARLQESGRAFDAMTAKLSGLVQQVAENAGGLSVASGQLAAAADQSAQVTGQIATTVQQVAQGTAQQSASVNTTAAAVEQLARAIDGVAHGAQEQAGAVSRSAALTGQITAAIQQVAASAQAGAAASAEAAQAARAGAETVDQTIHGMDSIRAKVSVSAEKVKEMGQRSEQIGLIVEMIDDIASQTNLLALNAAIEAARAGAHGKGFAVVADEVRKLAEKSAAATKDIAGLVQDIQRTVAQAVNAMDEGAREVEAGAAHASRAGESLSGILQSSESVNGQMGQIATAARAMSAASNELVGAMDAVSAVVEENTAATEQMAASARDVTGAIENIASVSEENSAAVEEVSASAEEMNAQVEEVTASAQSLAAMAQSLQALVAQFKLDQASEARPAVASETIPSAPARLNPPAGLDGHRYQGLPIAAGR
jgi:methyl-accepting chemotaxis protein